MIKAFWAAMCILAFSRCATVGSQFQFHGSESIVKGETSLSQILATYGDPFRVGYENGNIKWTYGFYHYRLFGDSETKDLDITFDKQGIVSSYSYSSSAPNEVKAGVSAALN